jgi:putative ABC transport system permease protein
VSSLPLDGTPYAYPMLVGVPSRPTDQPVAMKFITPGYFETMRTPIVEGASLALDERIDAPDPVVVSAAFARRFFPGESPIGKQVVRLESDGNQVEIFGRPVPTWTIVGVVTDVHEESLRVRPAEIVYVPVRDPAVERSIVPTSMTLVIRAGVRSTALTTAVRNTIRAFDPGLSVARIRTMDEIVTRSIASERFLAALLLAAAAASLFLGAVGVYGVAAHAVRRREREIGIRVSLGATPRQLLGMVLGQLAVLVVIGSTAGLALAFIATRPLRSFLFDVSTTDPATVGIATVLLILTALAASVLPARRAVRLDPVAALRSE